MAGMGLNFTAIDFEAANSNRTSAISVGWATVRGGSVMEHGSWLIRPHTGLDSFDPYAIRIHGIIPSMVADAATLGESMIRLAGIIGDLPVVAHNARYDRAVLLTSSRAVRVPEPRNEFRCTAKLAGAALGLKKTRLDAVAEHLDLPDFAHHDAGADALTSARIVIEIARRRSADDLTGLYRQLGIG